MHSLDPKINIESCLESIHKINLNKSLKICNKVIETFPNDPEPLNDRSLIYILLGKERLACKDIENAIQLIKNKPKIIDPLINYQITVRQDSCKKL